MKLYGSILVSAADCDPEYRCQHDDGQISVDLTSELGGLSLVLTGTPESIARLSGQLQAVAEAYVSQLALDALDAVETALRPAGTVTA